MPESGSSGSVRGALRNERPYRERRTPVIGEGESVIVVLSCVLSYVFCGLAYVSESLRADALSMPGWAHQPTLRKILLFGTIWPLPEIANAPSVAFGTFTAALQFVVVGLIAWCCIGVSTFLFANIGLQILSVAVLLFISGRFLLPWVGSLLAVLAGIIILPISLVLPSKDKSVNRNIHWRKNCTHYRKSARYEKIPGGLYLAETMPPTDDLPCEIAKEALDVWAYHFDLELKSRTLYPKDCRLFEPRA